MATNGRRWRRLLRGALWVMAIAQVVEALALRRRRAQLAILPESDGKSPAGDVVVAAVDGAAIDDGTLSAVRHEMAGTGLEAIDLVPGDLPADRVLRMLRRLRPDKVGSDPLASPGGAHEAVALHRDLATRIEAGQTDGLDRGDLARLTVKAQRYAPSSACLRLAPGVRAAPSTPLDRWREHEALTAFARPSFSLAPVVVGAETAHLLAMTAGLMLAPAAGLAALATWSAQPALVTSGRAPAAASLLRLPRAWADNIRTALAGLRSGPGYERPGAHSRGQNQPGGLFEERRTTCPWCDAGSLVGRLDVAELWRQQPGTFHLDKCTSCGHICQNPALSLAGLDYYYGDFYEGSGDETLEFVFAGAIKFYERRAEAVGRFTEPRAWLDVGTGHGHFCLAARQRWPEAIFDGLDMGEAVIEAQRRGWIDTAYQGLFPELADGLPRSYDVVSMHHCLEHTRDPRSELAAAAKVLDPGGYLSIEVPDPESPWARRLGRYWAPWFQPQHQHFIPCANLTAELEASGFDLLSLERGPSDMGLDIFAAVWLALQNLVPSRHYPWLPATSPAYGLWRAAAHVAAMPVLTCAAIADWIKDAYVTPNGIGNAYRVVARRR